MEYRIRKANMSRVVSSRNILYPISCVPTELNTKEPEKQPKLIAFRPEELPKALETLKTTASSEKVFIVPIQHYNSAVFNRFFEEMLKDKSLRSKNITINIPWARPGSWSGCNTRCEELEKEVMKNFDVYRELV